MKPCETCGGLKFSHEFRRSTTTRDGLSKSCETCLALALAEVFLPSVDAQPVAAQPKRRSAAVKNLHRAIRERKARHFERDGAK